MDSQQGTQVVDGPASAAARAWAVERNEGNLEAGRAYSAGGGPFPQRTAQSMLAGSPIRR